MVVRTCALENMSPKEEIEDRPSPKRQRLSSQQLTPVVTPPPSTMPSPPIRPWELGYPSRRPPMPPQVCHRCSTPGTHQAGCPARSPFHQSPGAHQHPNLQNPGAHQHPNLQNPGAHQHPNLQNPGAHQHPNLQNPGAHQHPNLQNPNLQNPNLQNPGAHQNPNLQNPNLQNPGALQHPNLQNPNLQNPGAHQHPNLQNPGAHQHPNLQHPNLQHPGAHQNPNLQNPNLQNPGAHHHPNLQNPGAQHAPLDRQSFAEELLAQPLIPLPYPHPHHLNAAQQQQDAMVRSLHEQHQSFAEELLAQPLIPLPHPHHHHLNAAQQQQDAMVRNLHEQLHRQGGHLVSYTLRPVPLHGMACPMCSGQHLPPARPSPHHVPSMVFSPGQRYHTVLQACTGTHLPMPFTFSSMMSRDPHFLLASQTQLAPGTFLPYQAPPPRSPLQQFETEVELLIEQMSVAGGYNYRHQQRHLHQNATPMQLFTNLDPVPQPYSPYTPRHTARRYNSQHPMPPAPHPSSFLPYISHPGTSNMGSFASVDDGEVENYEALLNLAERLGEAMPRGLTTADIDQLPSYRFNPSSHQSEQTMCVVCMCDYETCQLLRVLPCNHQFHSKCVDKWLKANRTCPICRADSSKVQTHSE
ncbi:hypothetical protein NHX12_017641 [Muraenolepis orangiensis]|uniref:RING-type domain-containing protein n=1 Tax=Muraenolepis orangiensis TaxID=630683 RepID=A0A9Q0IWW0_9TELE|nr:hypothetical protein NHX12_017641 [Muraenolepis orangiensis]